jgi:hypothetical protein
VATIDLRATASSIGPLNLDGDPTGPARDIDHWPAVVAQLSRFTVPVPRELAATISTRTLLTLRSADGSPAAELRVIGSRPAD